MNLSWKFCLLLIIVLATRIHEVLSIKCWECRSDADLACADPIDNSSLPLVDCIDSPELPNLLGVRSTMCRKTRQRVNGIWRVFRSCAYLGEPDVGGNQSLCLRPPRRDRTFVEYCTCNNTDGCNTGPTVYSNQHFILFAAFLCFINCFYNR